MSLPPTTHAASHPAPPAGRPPLPAGGSPAHRVPSAAWSAQRWAAWMPPPGRPPAARSGAGQGQGVGVGVLMQASRSGPQPPAGSMHRCRVPHFTVQWAPAPSSPAWHGRCPSPPQPGPCGRTTRCHPSAGTPGPAAAKERQASRAAVGCAVRCSRRGAQHAVGPQQALPHNERPPHPASHRCKIIISSQFRVAHSAHVAEVLVGQHIAGSVGKALPPPVPPLVLLDCPRKHLGLVGAAGAGRGVDKRGGGGEGQVRTEDADRRFGASSQVLSIQDAVPAALPPLPLAPVGQAPPTPAPSSLT